MTISNDYSNETNQIQLELPGIAKTTFYIGALAAASLVCFGLVKYAPSNPSQRTAEEIGINLNAVKNLKSIKKESEFKSQQLEDLDTTTNMMMVDY